MSSNHLTPSLIIKRKQFWWPSPSPYLITKYVNTPLINKVIEWLLYKLPTYGAYICSNELLRLTIGYIMKKIRFIGKYMINISKNSFSDTTIIILKSFKLGNHILWIESNEAHFMGYLQGKKYWQEVILAHLTDWLKNCHNMPVIIPTKICFFSDPPKFIPAK